MAEIKKEKEYIGTVIDNKDPNCSGRCKIFVSELMKGMDESLIPWASPGETSVFAGSGGGSLSVPKPGTVVKVRFKNEEIKAPEYYGIQKIDRNLINEIKSDYENAQVLLYDHDNDLSVLFLQNSGLRFYYKGSYIQINPDGMVTLNHAGDSAIIQLQGDKMNIVTTNEITLNSTNSINVQTKTLNLDATESTNIKGDALTNSPEMAVNGKELFNFLLFMAKIIDTKYPATPYTCEGRLQTIKPKILNSKIKYV